MTPIQALQILAGLLNQAEFKGTIAAINTMGQQAQEALRILEAAIKPVENTEKI